MNSQNVIVNLYEHNQDDLFNLNIDSNKLSDDLPNLNNDSNKLSDNLSCLDIDNLPCLSNNLLKLDTDMIIENNDIIAQFLDKEIIEIDDIDDDVNHNCIIERILFKEFNNVKDIVCLHKLIKKLKICLQHQENSMTVLRKERDELLTNQLQNNYKLIK